MKINHIKVRMSKVGMTTPGTKRKVLYMPIARIEYAEKEISPKEVHLDMAFLSDKNYFRGWIEGQSYFAGVTNDSYQIYDENGIRTGTVLIEKVGMPIQANENDFVCLKGRIASWVSKTGECKSRELTDDEYNSIKNR